MKKLYALIFVFIMSFYLCGCNFNETISRSGTESIVSAIGFDQTGDKISVILETIITNAENSESETRLLIGTGDTIQTAFADTLKYATEPLTLSHLGVAVMGETLNNNNFKSICDWFYNKQDTTLSTFFISSQNAEELLSQKAISSMAVGYDLVGLLEQQEKESGADYQNRFYKIQSLILENADSFALPHFVFSDEKIYLDGIMAYKNCQPQLLLMPDDTIFYLMASNKQKAGTIILDEKPIKIISSKAKYRFENQTVFIDISLKTQQETFAKEPIQQGISELLSKSKTMNIDILNISKIAEFKNPQLWENLQVQSNGGLQSLNIEVTVND